MIVPTRDGGAYLKKCLAAAKALASTPQQLDFVVVDNGSTDEATCQFVEELATSGQVRLVRDPAPFNWARLNNRAARECSANILLFLNDDVELMSKGWDQQLRHYLDRQEVGAVGCRLAYPDGRIQHAGVIFGPTGSFHEGRGEVTPEIRYRWESRRSVAAVTGAFLACRRRDFELLDGFDEASFPIWFNDIDFCLRMRSSGLRILYLPEIRGTHLESATLKRKPDPERDRRIWHESQWAMRERWGQAFRGDPSVNPHFVQNDFPFESISEPSFEAILSHLKSGARANAWAVAQQK